MQQHVSQLLQQAKQLLRQGQPQQAAQLCDQVIQADPNNDQALYQLGEIAFAMKDYKAAKECMRRALQLNPEEPRYCFCMAQFFLDERNLVEASKLAQKAVEMEPENASFHILLGQVYGAGRMFDKALDAYGNAMKHEVKDSSNYINLYEAMIHIYEMRRDDTTIGELLEQLHEEVPNAPPLVVEVQYKRRTGDYDGALEIGKKIVANPPGGMQLSNTLVEMGMVHDKLGQYDEAYEAFAEGQKLASVEGAPKAKDSMDFFDSVIDACSAWFDKNKVKGRNIPVEDGIADPIFLVGFPRSGTTLTEQILASHPNIHVLEEFAIISKLIMGMSSVTGRPADYPQALEELTQDEIQQLRKIYMRFATQLLSEKGETVADGARIVDKLPFNINHLGLIQRLFPQAKVLIALRDPRDCCLSCFMQHFTYNSAMKHFFTLEGTVKTYARVMDLYFLYKDIVQLDMLEFRYEDMVEDQEGTTRKLIDHIGETWDDEVLKFYEHSKKKDVYTPSYTGVSQPIYKSAKARWKHYEKYFEPYQAQLRPYLEAFGYEVVER